MVDRIRYPTVSYLPFYYVFWTPALCTPALCTPALCTPAFIMSLLCHFIMSFVSYQVLAGNACVFAQRGWSLE